MINKNIEKFCQELKKLSKSESIPCVGGKSDLPTQLGLKVKGRYISLPVNEDELNWLCEHGSKSPFGKGMDTITDTNVRKSIEFEAEAIEVTNPNWRTAFDELLNNIITEMGIDFKVDAELFKLLIYRKGGHFKFHQDTEKSDGMFGTLIVQLPSKCDGGSLNSHFAGEKYHFDFGNKDNDSEFFIHYAAHYADVHHQVEKIEEGSRLVLVYNLVQPKKERKLSANHHKQLLDSSKDKLMPVISLFEQQRHSLLLQHEYTEKSLSDLGFLSAKGQDREILKSLVAINTSLPLDKKLNFMIARVSYTVTSDGCGGEYGRGNVDWDEIERTEPYCDLLFDEDGQKIPVSKFNIDWVHDLGKQNISSTAFGKLDGSFWGKGHDYIEGYMGNYGPTKETTYARCLLVIMPLYLKSTNSSSKDITLQVHKISLMAKDIKNNPSCDWLKEQYDEALKAAIKEFNSVVCDDSSLSRWEREFSSESKAIFAKLLKASIETNDSKLCQKVLNMAKVSIVASLSSEYSYEDILEILKKTLKYFGWDKLSLAYQSIVKNLTGSVALKISLGLAEVINNHNMRSTLIEIFATTICGEVRSWGRSCGFNDAILPLAVVTCNTSWHACDKVKNMFLDTCLKKSTKSPSFLSVLIQRLVKDSQADNKEWLLQRLITVRLEYLGYELNKDLHEFSWSMPYANTRKKEITEFLRSDTQELQLTGYDGIAMARKDIIAVKKKSIQPEFYMESDANYTKVTTNHSFSATMEAKGRGKAAYLEISKDKKYYDLCLKLRKLRQQEYKRLKGIVDAF